MSNALMPVTVEYVGGPFDGLRSTMVVPLTPTVMRPHITPNGDARAHRYVLDAGTAGQPVYRHEQ